MPLHFCQISQAKKDIVIKIQNFQGSQNSMQIVIWLIHRILLWNKLFLFFGIIFLEEGHLFCNILQCLSYPPLYYAYGNIIDIGPWNWPPFLEHRYSTFSISVSTLTAKLFFAITHRYRSTFSSSINAQIKLNCWLKAKMNYNEMQCLQELGFLSINPSGRLNWGNFSFW